VGFYSDAAPTALYVLHIRSFVQQWIVVARFGCQRRRREISVEQKIQKTFSSSVRSGIFRRMANTYSQIYIHIVFAVAERQFLIRPECNEELQKYITGIVSGQKQKLIAINNMPDHMHILVGLQPDLSISNLVRDVKANSSAFIKQKRWVAGRFSWQEGFGAFSYSRSQVGTVVRYIENQPEHHRRKTFREEYIELLEKFNVDYDPKYIFKGVV
jgi:putative transposase